MKESIIMLRTLNMLYHHMHNVARGSSFSSDHAMLAQLYAQLELEYDMLIERYIGTGGELSRDMAVEVLTEAASFLAEMPDSMGAPNMSEFFSFSLTMEGLLRGQLESAMAGASKGTENLLQDLCDKSEARTYLLKRRIAPC